MNFSDAMILEAARRSANASAPLPYMNKLLSEWKREGVFNPDAVKEREASAPTKPAFRSEAAIAADHALAPQDLPALTQKMNAYRAQRRQALLRLGIREEDLSPRYECSKCSDTGFLPNGKVCDCYPDS